MLAVTLTFAEALNKNVMLLPSASLPSSRSSSRPAPETDLLKLALPLFNSQWAGESRLDRISPSLSYHS